MDNTTEKNGKNTLAAIIITQFISVILVVLSVFIIKKVAPKTYTQLKKFYKSEISAGTSVKEFTEYLKK